MRRKSKTLLKAEERLRNFYRLETPEEVGELRDHEILRVDGVGRHSLDLIRLHYPKGSAETEVPTSPTPLQGSAIIRMGRIEDVEAIRHDQNRILIRQSGRANLMVIGAFPPLGAALPDAARIEGLGHIPPDAFYRKDQAFPSFYDVRQVTLDEPANDGAAWTSTLSIEVEGAVFELELSGAEDAPGGVGRESANGAFALPTEISADKTAARMRNALEPTWEAIQTHIARRQYIGALVKFADSAPRVLEYHHYIHELAAVRGAVITCRSLGLSSTDRKREASDDLTEEAYAVEYLYPQEMDPSTVVCAIMKGALEESTPPCLNRIKELLAGIPAELVSDLPQFLGRCDKVLQEIDDLKVALCKPGASGIRQRDLIDAIDARHPDDEMVRRALKRWVNAAHAAKVIVKAKSRHGVVIRLADTTPTGLGASSASVGLGFSIKVE